MPIRLRHGKSAIGCTQALISFAFAFELAVAGYLSDNFLHFAPGLLSRALDAIFVHHNGQYFERSRIIDGRNRYGTEISDHYYTAPLGPRPTFPAIPDEFTTGG